MCVCVTLTTRYDIPEVTPWGLQTINVPNCNRTGGVGCQALVDGSIEVAVKAAKMLNAAGKVPMYANPGTFLRPLVGQNIWLNESLLVDALAAVNASWYTYYESARAETMLHGCPGVPLSPDDQRGWCVLYNLLRESSQGVPAGVHTYLQHVNRSDPLSPVESQLPHIAAFMLARNDNWFYFGSTGWWDNSYVWDPLWDNVTRCGLPRQPAPSPDDGPLYTRMYDNCNVTLDCRNTSFCKGGITFGF